MRKEGFTTQAVDPENPGGPLTEVVIPVDLCTKWYKESSVDFYNLETAKAVLERPERIFSRPRFYEEGGFCYVGRPREWYVRPACKVPLPRNTVFAVYVNPNGRLYEVRLERADADDPACPVDWKRRYGDLLWKATS